MSTSCASQPESVEPVRAGVVGGGAGDVVAGLGSAVSDLLGAQWWRLGEGDLVAALRAVDGQQRRLGAVLLSLVAEAASRGVPASSAMTDTGSWVAHRLQLRPSQGAAWARTAAVLAPDLTGGDLDDTAVPDTAVPDAGVPDTAAGLGPTARALAAGRVSLDHAHVIVAAITGLDPEVSDTDRAAGQVFLLEQALVLDAGQLARAARALVATLNPATTRPNLADAEDGAHRRRRFALVEEADGTWWVSGHLDGEGGRTLNAALDPLAGPRPADGTGPDLRTPTQRRADALVEVAERVLAIPDTDPGALPTTCGARPTVVTTIDFEALRRNLTGVAYTDTNTPISPDTARRLACDAHIYPALLGTTGTVLDLGRSSYAVPAALRRAVILRDGGCAVPGCHRPPEWCHCHHIWHWCDGGPTDLDNLVLACGHHHRAIHDKHLFVTITNGRPHFTLPAGAPLTDHTIDPWRATIARIRPQPPNAAPDTNNGNGSSDHTGNDKGRPRCVPGRAAPLNTHHRNENEVEVSYGVPRRGRSDPPSVPSLLSRFEPVHWKAAPVLRRGRRRPASW